MDAFDDFELKPITKGLGFHKKPISLADETKKQALDESVLPREIPAAPAKSILDDDTIERPLAYEDLLKSLSTSENQRSYQALSSELRDLDMDLEPSVEAPISISEPLPRRKERFDTADFSEPIIQPKMPTPMPLDDFLKDTGLPVDDGLTDIPIPGGGLAQTPVKQAQPEQKADPGIKRSSSNSPAIRLEESPICLRSIFLDALMVVALSLVFLASLLAITGVSLSSVLINIKTDISTQIPIAILYLAIYQIYVIGTRSFYGRTLGEWTFDHQLGREKEQEDGAYPLKVVWRSVVIILTGIIVLPTLSFLCRIDLARYLTGLQLYKLKD